MPIGKHNESVITIKKAKSCGCLIASNVIAFEIEKRKKLAALENITNRIKKSKNKKTISKLKSEGKILLESVKKSREQKNIMKKRFSEYVKNSGYVPPKFKKQR